MYLSDETNTNRMFYKKLSAEYFYCVGVDKSNHDKETFAQVSVVCKDSADNYLGSLKINGNYATVAAAAALSRKYFEHRQPESKF